MSAIIRNPDLLTMTPAQWRQYADHIQREGVTAPTTPANTERDAALVKQFERILAAPPSKEAAEAARAYLTARRPAAAAHQPALVVPGVVSEADWLKAPAGHARYLERLWRDRFRGCLETR